MACSAVFLSLSLSGAAAFWAKAQSSYTDEMSTTPPDLLEKLVAIIGAPHVLRAESDMAGYVSEPRDLFHGRARAVVRPGSTQEVAAILRLCHETGTADRKSTRLNSSH